jgi:ABC-type multidrug transport system, ATPase component
MNEAIVIDDLKVTRGSRRILKGVSISLEKGSITGLLGPSGSGKSTLIRSIAGVQKIESGTVTILGRPAGSRAARASVGYMTQASAAYKDLTVRENVAHWARIARAPASAVDEIISQLRLTDRAHALASNISGGQASRLSLACTMVGNPPVLLLDEPTVGLDPVLREEIWDLIRERAAAGTTVLVSSHVMDEAQRCDSLVFIREGDILATGTAESILEDTATSSMDAAFLALAKEQAE